MPVDYLTRYVAEAPLSMALARAVECKVLTKTPIEPPVLDLGCGDGLFARIFFQGTRVAAGIDIDAAEARRARASGAYNEVFMASGAALPFAEGSFRTILSNSVLEHVPELAATLVECHRVLEPHGKIIITVPLTQLSDCFFYGKVLRYLGGKKAATMYANWKHRIWRHYNMYDKDGWALVLREAGFRVDSLLLFNSRPTSELADMLFPLSPPSLLIKKLFGRMVLRPAFLSRLLALGLRGSYERDGVENKLVGTICIVATKNPGKSP